MTTPPVGHSTAAKRPDFLTLAEVRALLRLKKRASVPATLPFVRTSPRRRLFWRVEVEQWLAAREVRRAVSEG